MELSNFSSIVDSTWAARGVGFGGQIKRITDYGPPAGILVVWRNSLSRWVLVEPINLGGPAGPVSGIVQSTEQVVQQVLLPESLLMAGRRLEFKVGMTKTGNTDNFRMRLHVGSLGTISDTKINPVDPALLNPGSEGYLLEFGIVSATSLLYLGTRSGGSWTGAADGTTQPSFTVPDMTAAGTYISVCAFMGGATDTPIINNFSLILEP